jgi:DNA-binding MarR family transcriptional regulator
MDNNLERLIQQNVPFRNDYVKAEVGLLYMSSLLHRRLQVQYKEFDLTHQQYNILRILRGQYPRYSNITLLRERMLDKMSDASRLVDRLCKAGLVSKHPDEFDKRNTVVLITEKALDLLEQIDQHEFEKATIFHELSNEELNKLNELMDKLLKHFTK